MIIQTYYVSTGAKNAMYTLRLHRLSNTPTPFDPDFHITNLSADAETAAYKATLYFNAMRERMGPDTETFRLELCTDGGQNFKRRGNLSTVETRALLAIENGTMPFGKHAGTQIADCPASYLLWLSDKAGTFDGFAMNALAAVAQGIALERGYIAARQEKREEQAAIDAASVFVGKVGERLDFEGEIVAVFDKRATGGYVINKIRSAGNLLVHVGGKPLGEVGQCVKVRATVKEHREWKGVKSTAISRPAIANR